MDIEAPSEPTDELPSEQDRPKIRAIGLWIAGTLLGLAVVVVGMKELFRSVIEGEISSKVLTHSSSELRELRAEEQARLTRYQWVSRKDGVVRIPVDRARELVLAGYHARTAMVEAPADDNHSAAGTRWP